MLAPSWGSRGRSPLRSNRLLTRSVGISQLTQIDIFIRIGVRFFCMDYRMGSTAGSRHLSVGGGTRLPICGDVVGGVRCSSEPTHMEHLYVSGCRAGTCPVCGPRWVRRAAESAAERFLAYFHVVHSTRSPRHVVISPPAGAYAGSSAWDLDSQVKSMQRFSAAASAIVTKMGLSAAIGLDHAYRPIHASAAPDSILLEDERGSNYYAAALASPDPSALLRFSPHRHLLVHGPLPNTADFFSDTGWVITNISARRGEAGLQAYAVTEVMLLRRLYYLLGHAWLLGNSRVVRYYGGVSFTGMSSEVVESGFRPIVCPVCGGACEGFLRHANGDEHFARFSFARYSVRDYRYHWHGFSGCWRSGSVEFQSVLNVSEGGVVTYDY